MGIELLFQTLCQANIERIWTTTRSQGADAVPHCFNTIKHEFPQFGGNYEVVHHTELIAR